MDRTVIIFGGSSGIGLKTSKYFISNGDRVYNCSRSSSPEPLCHNITVDVVNEGAISAAVEDIYRREGRIDIVVYSAGFSMAAPVEHVESIDYKYLFQVNFFSAVETVKAVIPYLKENGGRIIHISSIGGVLPIPYDSYYSASKAALNMFTEAAQFELRKQGIFMTSVMPGGTRTPFSFKRKIYPSEKSGEYTEAQINAVECLTKTEQNGMLVSRVAKCIYNLTELPDPPILYSCGIINKCLHFFSKILSKRSVYWLIKLKYRV